MAYEIQASEMLWEPPVPEDIFKYTGRREDKAASSPEISTIGAHSYQHDLESLFWLLLWIVLTRTGHRPSIKASLDVFQDSRGPTTERRLLLTKGFSTTLVKSFHPDTVDFMEELGRLRLFLYWQYRKREPERMLDVSTYSCVCAGYIRFFSFTDEPSVRTRWAGLPLVDPSDRHQEAERISPKAIGLPAEASRRTTVRPELRTRKRKAAKPDGEVSRDGRLAMDQAQVGPCVEVESRSPTEQGHPTKRARKIVLVGI